MKNRLTPAAGALVGLNKGGVSLGYVVRAEGYQSCDDNHDGDEQCGAA